MSSSISTTVTIADSIGVRALKDASELPELIARGKFFWLDIAAGEGATPAGFVSCLGVDAPDIQWAQRFGQAGRMAISKQRLRAVTWLAESSWNLMEVHVLCTRCCLLTIWRGDSAILGEVRQHFAERSVELEKSPYAAAGILLQLLLGTLGEAISNLDTRIQDYRDQLERGSIDYVTLKKRLQKLQAVWSAFDRYGSAVRLAIVGVEAVPGMDPRGADELNDYAEQVEDIEHRLRERVSWSSDIVQDYATAIAQHQSEQINRLTLVSLIFLPITFLTGFFGMNFSWLNELVGSARAFVLLGVLLPAFSVLLTVVWLRWRKLV
jgi:Mg2+ and Co2+ transporter CorA